MFYSFLKKRGPVLLAALFVLTAAVSHAIGDDLLPAGMTSLMTKIQEVFTGDFVKGILVVSLAGCAVAYGFNKDNERMKRNIIAIAVACAILFAASSIINNITAAAQQA
jgi:type IV secretory pathway VirB2 component (pilin)